jgi:microcystin-dependent protein
MSEQFLGEIRIVGFNFPPRGWAFCNGQTLAIQQNQALFALMGTFYGGNGVTTFQLPNLQGRVANSQGTSPSGSQYTIGQISGQETQTLLVTQIPQHNHLAVASSTAATLATPANNLWGSSTTNPYSPSQNTTMNAAALSQVGGSQPHENRSPFLVLNFIIALTGIFPSRN